MKKLILSTFMMLIMVSMGHAQKKFNFGAGAQLVFDNSVFGVQGKALYNVNETWSGAGTFTFHLKEFYDWTIDLDAHYKLLKVSDKFNLAPIAGLAISRVSVLGISDSDIGINLGAFIDFVPSDSFHIYVEPKIVIGGLESFAISAGVLF